MTELNLKDCSSELTNMPIYNCRSRVERKKIFRDSANEEQRILYYIMH